jgi:hypothetical protein
MAAEKDPLRRAARKSGRWVHFAGLIYSEWRDDVHIVPDRAIPRTSAGVRCGHDFFDDRPGDQQGPPGGRHLRLAQPGHHETARAARGVLGVEGAGLHGRGRRSSHSRDPPRARVPAGVDDDRPGGAEPASLDRPEPAAGLRAASDPDDPRAERETGRLQQDQGTARLPGRAVAGRPRLVRRSGGRVSQVPVEEPGGQADRQAPRRTRSNATTTCSTLCGTW